MTIAISLCSDYKLFILEMDTIKIRPVNLYRLSQITEKNDTSIEFCKYVGLIPKQVNCPTCSAILEKPYYIKNRNATQIRYQCNKRSCRGSGKRNTISLKSKNWFSKSNISMQKSLFLTYAFVHQMSYKDTIREMSIGTTCDQGFTKVVTTSRETVCDYKRYCRDICYQIVQNNSCDKIGGPGLNVEIDESKFGKSKYNRGRYIKGQWVFGGICCETREFFITTVDKRDKKTLLPIILEKIHPGSTIFSDCWKAYSTINQYEYEHKTVNHTYNFVDPTTQAHTQNIENLWWQIKRGLPSTHSCHDQLYLHLSEYMWRNSKDPNCDLFIEFLNDAGKYVSSHYM